MTRALLGAALAALLVPAGAAAHASLTGAHPGEQSRIEAPPTEITLRYDQSVTATADSIIVLAPDGRRLSGRVSQAAGGTMIRAPLEGLVRGRGGRHHERHPRGPGEGAPHRAPPARSERCPKIGAMSRSAKSITATAIQVIANP